MNPYHHHRFSLVVLGAVLGLAWASGLRGWMAQLVEESVVTSAGTFGATLLPGLIMGALLGWAEYIRRTGGRPRWRWLALSPLVLAVVTFADFPALFTTGVGGGALAVPMVGIAGGYAISGQGSRWKRIASGVLPSIAVLGGPAVAVAAFLGFGIDAKIAWLGVYLSSFLAVVMVASSIPYRTVVGRQELSTDTEARSDIPTVAM